MAQRRAGTGTRSGGVLLAGTLVANVLSYAFFAVLGRHLGTAELGAVGSVVNLSVLAAVALLGLQLVAARLVSRHGSDDALEGGTDRTVAAVVGAALALGTGVAVVVAAASPVLARLLHLDVATLLLLAVTMVPTSLCYGVQGVLQGLERFGRLAVLLAAAGTTKIVAALGTAALGGSVTHVVGLLALGWVVVAALALALLPGSTVRRGLRRPPRVPHLHRLVAAAVVPTSGLLFLSGIDVLLARHVLDGPGSGAYTVGALFEKAAFWGLGFLATLHYPGMAVPQRRRRAMVTALATTAAVGAVGIGVTVALGTWLVTAVAGPAYAGLGPGLWRFTALGVCLALVQVLAYAGLARASTRMGVALWVGGVAVVALTIARGGAVDDVVDTVLGVTVALVLVGGLVEAQAFRASGDGVPDGTEPVGSHLGGGIR